jgi:hypothetical protein
MFNNPIPHFDDPTYSICVDHEVHMTFHNQALWDSFVFEDTQKFDVKTVPRCP